MKHRVKNGELWVLVKIYITPGGFVAHWFSHSGANSHEPIDVKFRLPAPRATAD